MPPKREQKRYFKISEVSQIVGVEPHVLRYWEREFKEIRPTRLSSQRLYSAEDIQIIMEIKKLLYEEGFTILGAKKQLSKCIKRQLLLREIKDELKAIWEMLKGFHPKNR
jgi:DNA-binding transcriptional MerR regulator